MDEFTIITIKQKDVVRRLGKEYLDDCEVAQWGKSKTGHYYPYSWKVSTDDLFYLNIKLDKKKTEKQNWKDVALDKQAMKHLKSI